MPETPEERSRLWSLALPSLAVVGGLVGLEWLRGRYQQKRVFLPHQLPSGLPEDLPELDCQDVEIPTDDGLTLHGWWLPRKNARGAVLYCHGSAGHLIHQGTFLQSLNRLEAHVLAFDYRGYGASTGKPSEEGLGRDVRAAFRFLTGEMGQAPQRVVLLGHSLGGAVAIDGALDLPVAGLVVQSSFTDVRDLARTHNPRTHWVARKQFCSLDKVRELTLPKLFIHGTRDAMVPPIHGRWLYEAAAPPKSLLLIPGAEHNDVHLHAVDLYRKRLESFLDRCWG
jgi:uncharacterized protein